MTKKYLNIKGEILNNNMLEFKKESKKRKNIIKKFPRKKIERLGSTREAVKLSGSWRNCWGYDRSYEYTKGIDKFYEHYVGKHVNEAYSEFRVRAKKLKKCDVRSLLKKFYNPLTTYRYPKYRIDGDGIIRKVIYNKNKKYINKSEYENYNNNVIKSRYIDLCNIANKCNNLLNQPIYFSRLYDISGNYVPIYLAQFEKGCDIYGKLWEIGKPNWYIVRLYSRDSTITIGNNKYYLLTKN